jgi:predicted MFS family arabinose efflux permease
VGSSRRSGRKYLWGIVAFGLLLLPIYFVKEIAMAAPVLFALGVANEYFGIPMLTIMQARTEDETRGRVFSVRITLTRVAGVLGLAGAGIAAQYYGVVPTIIVVGAYMICIGMLGFLMPALREA